MRFPVYIEMEEKKVLVFGGGTIATRRIHTLLPFGCRITVIAPEISDELRKETVAGRLIWHERRYQEGDCGDADLVLAATDLRQVNQSIYREAKSRQIPVNVCDCKEECDFYFPGIVTEGGLVIGVTANGSDHRLAREAAEKIRSLFVPKESPGK
ncbi:precorrin-2 dehydrogenase/sirohydrochlorin ferrochelatase family protein [Diplocloster modestus]|uniref:precorrin-2 dehydrogenase n=1 Tax=Diplocloster modestus TaxID=2850322 RepID=A0ABS6KBB4_9FIRM|nr:bifunctional precorrin-2 dehydrogenase/sirohydrochlorin ferrochelatase [Diplocloster modestus]MBU9727806.1 bifunctional precorrin-2 dehydrogenase/sirohydrochlorin ferrochelatase [Diplocloster modestus]